MLGLKGKTPADEWHSLCSTTNIWSSRSKYQSLTFARKSGGCHFFQRNWPLYSKCRDSVSQSTHKRGFERLQVVCWKNICLRLAELMHEQHQSLNKAYVRIGFQQPIPSYWWRTIKSWEKMHCLWYNKIYVLLRYM